MVYFHYFLNRSQREYTLFGQHRNARGEAGQRVEVVRHQHHGQSELLESVSGMRDQSAGTIRLNGVPLSLEGDDGAARYRALLS